MTPQPDQRAASWSAAVLCRFPNARPTAPEDWRTPQAAALPAARAAHAALVGLVERILAAKRANPAADTTALEREIDARVYRLYLPAPRPALPARQAGGLTPDEIKPAEEEGQP